jgi:hypothetical protein
MTAALDIENRNHFSESFGKPNSFLCQVQGVTFSCGLHMA